MRGIVTVGKTIMTQLDSVDPCPICYCTLHPSTHALPNKACPQCVGKFHSDCLNVWFRSSNSNTCPLCRQPMVVSVVFSNTPTTGFQFTLPSGFTSVSTLFCLSSSACLLASFSASSAFLSFSSAFLASSAALASSSFSFSSSFFFLSSSCRFFYSCLRVVSSSFSSWSFMAHQVCMFRGTFSSFCPSTRLHRPTEMMFSQ